MSPNPILAEKYNTGDIEKNRDVVSSISKEASDLQWGMGLLGAGIALAMMQQARRKSLESDVMEHRMAASERERLYPVNGSLRHTRAPVIIPSAMSPMVPVGMDEGMVRIAAAIGSDMASMEKDAAFGIGAAAGGMKNLLTGAARGIKQRVGGALAPNGVGMGTKIRQGFQEMGAHMTDIGNKAQGIKAAPGQSQLAKMRDMHSNQNLVSSAMQNTKSPATLHAPGLQPPKPAVQTGGVPGAAPAPTPAAPAGNVNTASGAAPATPSNQVADKRGLLERSGLFNDQGKLRTGRLVGAGALMGAGYLGYKGLSAGMDYMQQHPHNANYNLGGNQMPMGVNQYGYPQY